MRSVILGAINALILSHFDNSLVYCGRIIVGGGVSTESLIHFLSLKILLIKSSIFYICFNSMVVSLE